MAGNGDNPFAKLTGTGGANPFQPPAAADGAGGAAPVANPFGLPAAGADGAPPAGDPFALSPAADASKDAPAKPPAPFPAPAKEAEAGPADKEAAPAQTPADAKAAPAPKADALDAQADAAEKKADDAKAAAAAAQQAGQSAEELLGLTLERVRALESALEPKTVQETLDGWQRQLEGHRTLFTRQCDAVDRWDAQVHEARLRLERAASDLRALRGTTGSLRSKLSEVRSGQDDLERRLEELERAIQERRSARPARLTAAARERREFYTRAKRSDALLSDLQSQVRALVDRLRRRGAAHSGDPRAAAAGKIRDVLDAHASDLEWVDAEAAALERRALAAEARLHRARP